MVERPAYDRLSKLYEKAARDLLAMQDETARLRKEVEKRDQDIAYRSDLANRAAKEVEDLKFQVTMLQADLDYAEHCLERAKSATLWSQLKVKLLEFIT